MDILRVWHLNEKPLTHITDKGAIEHRFKENLQDIDYNPEGNAVCVIRIYFQTTLDHVNLLP